jgi:hypothetical protein
MATTPDVVRERIASICASAPFGFTQAVTPFDFSKQPAGQIDQVFRVTQDADRVIGGLNYTEDRTDVVEIWLARKQSAAANAAYTQLLADAAALRSAVIRDGSTGGGDYAVPDEGHGMRIQHDPGSEFAVLRVSLAVNYEVQH